MDTYRFRPMKITTVLLLVFLFSGCVSSNSQVAWGSYQNTTYEYSISIPERAYIPGKDKTKDQIFFGILDSQLRDPSEKFMIFLYAMRCEFGITNCNASHLPQGLNYFQISCKETIKNSTVIEDTENTYTVTGEFPGYPCSTHACDTSIYGMEQYKGRYLLCSEHDGKTVVVEINQVTPDPEMAEKIFSTFKWTE
jgi:hypothetical protein